MKDGKFHPHGKSTSVIHAKDVSEPKIMHKSQVIGLKKNLPKLSQYQIEKLDMIWIRLDVPQRAMV